MEMAGETTVGEMENPILDKLCMRGACGTF